MTETMQTIKDLMRLQNISQRDMAEKVGVAEATMSRWMNGTRNPDIQYVEKMAEVLGRSLIVGYERRWIPVSERLPKENDVYLVALNMIGYPIRDIDGFYTQYKRFEHYGNNVLAWMPLPEPYKEDAGVGE